MSITKDTAGTRAAVVIVAALMTACGARTPTTPTGGGSVAIAAVTPPVLMQTTVPQDLTITGTGFVFTSNTFEVIVTKPAGDRIEIQRGDIRVLRPTAFEVTVPMPDAGQYTFVVVNSTADRSDPFAVTVSAIGSTGAPVLTSISPSIVMRDAVHAQTVSIAGTGFITGLTLRVTDPGNITVDRTDITISSATALDALVTFSKAGTYTFRLVTATGELSNAVTVSVSSAP